MTKKKVRQPLTVSLLSSEEEPSASSDEDDGEQLDEGEQLPVSLDHPCQDIYQRCKCKKGSQSCLSGIIPGPDGYRKKGLWQKDALALVVQGPDPSDQERQVWPNTLAPAPLG